MSPKLLHWLRFPEKIYANLQESGGAILKGISELSLRIKYHKSGKFQNTAEIEYRIIKR